MPTVSILIPSYNHARFLRTCLATVRAQTFPDWEALVVDDGSSDHSVELAGAIASEDSRIKVHRNTANLGTYGTEQRALEMTSAPYVAVLNSDDLWHPRKLESQIGQLEGDPSLPLSYCLGHVVDGDTRLHSEDVHDGWPIDPVQDALPYLLFENRILASSVLFRRVGLRFEPSLRYSGDWVALLEQAGGRIGCVPERLTYWRVHGRNTYTMSEDQMLEEIRVRRAILQHRRAWFAARSDPRAVKRALAKNAMNLVACHLFFGDNQGAHRAGFIAARLWPSRLTMRRLFGSYAPIEQSMRHLWKDRTRAWTPDETAENRRKIAELPPLDLGR